MLDAERFDDFTAAARGALDFLRERLGFDLCMLTRTEGDEWTVLQASDACYGVRAGDVLPWSESFCSRMVRGEGPRIAPDAATVPAFATAGVARQMKIGAYVGVPLTRADGSLFGTLCAVHPDPKDTSLVDEQPLVELISRMLSTLLESELETAAETRRAERAEDQALTDALTGLYNRRGWDQLTASEDERCARYGHPACVLSIDLNGLKAVNDGAGHEAGDRLLQRAARAIHLVLRQQDVAARTGGDEFLVMGVECGGDDAASLRDRVWQALSLAGVSASIGLARRGVDGDLTEATQRADERMYVCKDAQRGGGDADEGETPRLAMAA